MGTPTSNMRAKFINESGGYWDNSSKYAPEYNDYWNELVPISGEANTLQGEVLRMMGRIMYDYFNNGFGNDRSMEAEFLEEHSNLFKQYMKNPNTWDTFYELYEEMCFGSYDELQKKAEGEASYGRGEDESDMEDYMEDMNDFIEHRQWDVENQMNDIMDGIVRYIQLTKDKLEPLQK